MGFRVVIPVRYESTRLPGKALLELCGKPMIQHVHDCAMRSQAQEVIIATDSERIQEAVEAFGARVCMTGAGHQSGTERLAEVVEQLAIPADDIVVNLQGDEPLMPHECIDQVARLLRQHSDAQVSTLCHRITEVVDVFDTNVVKVVRDVNDYALYFSRAPIPWHREAFRQQPPVLPQDTGYFRHIGLYAYRAGYIQKYLNAASAPYEEAESLEQLRIMWHGEKIIAAEAEVIPGPGVDTPEDLQKVCALLS